MTATRRVLSAAFLSGMLRMCGTVGYTLGSKPGGNNHQFYTRFTPPVMTVPNMKKTREKGEHSAQSGASIPWWDSTVRRVVLLYHGGYTQGVHRGILVVYTRVYIGYHGGYTRVYIGWYTSLYMPPPCPRWCTPPCICPYLHTLGTPYHPGTLPVIVLHSWCATRGAKRRGPGL